MSFCCDLDEHNNFLKISSRLTLAGFFSSLEMGFEEYIFYDYRKLINNQLCGNRYSQI